MSKEDNRPLENQDKTRTYSTWLGFAVREMTPGKSVRIRIRWGRVGILFLILCILGWTAKSVGLYYFFKEVRDFEDVSFMDMVFYPVNRSSVRVQQLIDVLSTVQGMQP